jgi:hypothetical protein
VYEHLSTIQLFSRMVGGCESIVKACVETVGRWKKRPVFVGAFSEFGGRVYRIPAPIFGVFPEIWSTGHQRGVGVR